MSNIIHIKDFNPQKEDNFFFDTNIWMHLFCSVGNYSVNNVNAYDNFQEIDVGKLFSKKDFDFNDQYIIEICKSNSICIVTHDKDFLNNDEDVIILTNHRVRNK